MQDNKEKEIMPELTLFPFEEEKEEIAEEKKDESQEWTDQILSEEERRIVDQFAEQIDWNPLLFIGTALFIQLLIIVCVVLRAWHIANENPVNSIKNE